MLDGFFNRIAQDIRITCEMIDVGPIYDDITTGAPRQ